MADASDNQRVAPARVAGARDRISALPDNVLLLVMSPLDARLAIQTCVLSRRWRHLWRSVPRINASIAEFEGKGADGFEDEVLFKKFVNRLLMLRNPIGLDEFRLWYRVPGDNRAVDYSADANLWVGHALQCNARAVEILNQLYSLQLVPAVFTSTYLKTLQISSATLILGFFRRLGEGCPELEHLFLLDCTIMDTEISSKTLKVLTFDTEVQFYHDHRTSISAPSLISLYFISPKAPWLPLLKEMTSLKTASVSFQKYVGDFDADDFRQFLSILSGVSSLEFCYGDRKLMVEKNYQWCPEFSNLINLTLHEWCLLEDFYALIVFLQNSPSLKKLTLKLNEPQELPSELPAIVGELEERSFTCDQLESVEIICSEDYPQISSVKQFLLDGGITSGQIRIKHQNELRQETPEFFRF